MRATTTLLVAAFTALAVTHEFEGQHGWDRPEHGHEGFIDRYSRGHYEADVHARDAEPVFKEATWWERMHGARKQHHHQHHQHHQKHEARAIPTGASSDDNNENDHKHKHNGGKHKEHHHMHDGQHKHQHKAGKLGDGPITHEPIPVNGDGHIIEAHGYEHPYNEHAHFHSGEGHHSHGHHMERDEEAADDENEFFDASEDEDYDDEDFDTDADVYGRDAHRNQLPHNIHNKAPYHHLGLKILPRHKHDGEFEEHRHQRHGMEILPRDAEETVDASEVDDDQDQEYYDNNDDGDDDYLDGTVTDDNTDYPDDDSGEIDDPDENENEDNDDDPEDGDTLGNIAARALPEQLKEWADVKRDAKHPAHHEHKKHKHHAAHKPAVPAKGGWGFFPW